MTKDKLALNLSKTSIQLLRKSKKRSWNVLGAADPSSENLEKDLARLKNQAAALSTKKPIVDVLLPRELVLSQTIVIEDDSSVEFCKRITAERCGLNENELLIAIGDSSTRSTVPVAAISKNSITESRVFVKNAGFRPEKYIAASKISGFKKSPVFFNDKSSKQLFELESKSFTKLLAFMSIGLFLGFLASLAGVFLGHLQNNRPYNYLANSENFLEKKNKPKTELILPSKVKKMPDKQLDSLNFRAKGSKFVYAPLRPRSQEPELNLPNRLSNLGQMRASLGAVKIEEIGLAETVFPASNPGKPKKIEDLVKVPNSIKQTLLSLYDNGLKETHGKLPKMEENFSIAGKSTSLLLKESTLVSKSLEPKRVSMFPAREKIINHQYKKILIEEVFSDLSLTKISITTSNKKASTEPLIYFETQQPDIVNPNNMQSVDYTNEKNNVLIRSNYIKQSKQSLNNLIPIDSNRLTLNSQFNLKLKKQGIKIELLTGTQDNYNTELGFWNGMIPTIKPKVVDTIKVLDDPTKSTGAVTFVGLPPKIPLTVINLKRVSANSIKNLNVRNNPPSIPKRSSIVVNSTQKNLIELNRTNLIGVFGKRTGRIALIRLSTGNTVKVRAGQQFGDGWKVISIDLDKIHITNGSRQETLRIPG